MRLKTATPRMRQVEALVAQAYTNEEIGRKLGLTTKTIKNMVSELLFETHSRNRTELALMTHNIIPASRTDRLASFQLERYDHPVNWDRS